MGTFSKSVLRVGEYHAPQGVVKVTPERLRHWEATTRSIQSVGYALPSHINHPDDPKFMTPLEMSALKERKKPEAQKTVGHLRSFTVAPDGQSAEIILETLTADAQEKVETNTLFVSPVIMPEWKDGAGNRYADAITSWDLVDWPVDFSQGGFVPVVAMSLNQKQSQPFLLSVESMDGEQTQDTEMADATPDTTPAEDTTKADPPATTPMGDMLAELAKLQIVLPDDTDGNNFIDRLLTALKTRNAVEAEPEEEDSDETEVDTSRLTQENPAMATMSLQLQRMEQRVIAQHKRDLNARLDACLKSGRCTPAQKDKIAQRMNVVTMSLGDNESVDSGDVESMLSVLEANAPGSQWTDEERTANIQLSLVPAPEAFGHGKSTKSEEDKAVDALTRDIRRAKSKQA